MERILKRSNLVSPLGAEFDPDDLALIIGTCVPDAVAVLDPDSGAVVALNERLRMFLGLGADAERAELTLDGFIHPDDRNLFRISRTEDFTAADGSIEIRFETCGGYLPAEVYFADFRWKRSDYLFAFIRPRQEKSVVETELKEKIVTQKRKTLDAIKSSLLIYQFTEKLKKTPLLTASLLSSDNENDLFQQASRILTSDGLNYKDVRFLMASGGWLTPVFSTKEQPVEPVCVEGSGRYERFFDHPAVSVIELDSEILVALRSRDITLGVMEVTLHPRERIFFDEVNLVRTWQKDALLTIGDMIAILLDNLRLYEKVRVQSITDPLTGVYNRNYFTNCLAKEIRACREKGEAISLIFIDVDRFKAVNDTYGHLVGDQILRGMGQILRENFRGYDFICRYGGDEFLVLLPAISEEDASSIARELLSVVREHDFELEGVAASELNLSVSVGVCVLDDELDENTFLRSADAALYRAKKLGRDRLVVFRLGPEGPREGGGDGETTLIETPVEEGQPTARAKRGPPRKSPGDVGPRSRREDRDAR